MEFKIRIEYAGRYRYYMVERYEVTDHHEYYRVKANNGEIVIQNNRPFLMARGLKRRRVDWKLSTGSFNKPAVVQSIIDAIILELRKVEGTKEPKL